MQQKQTEPQQTSSGPARKLIDVSPHRTTGAISIKGITPYPAEHESYTERYTIATLALCHDVVQIRSQPHAEEYLDEKNKKRKYTPDLLIKTKTTQHIVEVKTLNYLFQPKAIAKYRQIGAHFRHLKQSFAFLTDAQIESGERFENVKILFRYSHSDLPQGALEKILQWNDGVSIAIRDLMTKLDLQLVEIYTAIAQKHLSIEWDSPLSDSAQVSKINQPLKGLSIESILSSGRYGGVLEQLALGIAPTDQQLLADGATWRQAKVLPNAYSSIGGFQAQTPFRSLAEDELRAGTVWDRRNRAPGKASEKRTQLKVEGSQK